MNGVLGGWRLGQYHTVPMSADGRTYLGTSLAVCLMSVCSLL